VVHSLGVTLGLYQEFIVMDDVFVDLSEDIKPVVVFFFGSIGSSVLGDEVNELSLSISDGCGQEGFVGLDTVSV